MMQIRQQRNRGNVLRRPSSRQRRVAALIALTVAALFGGLWLLQWAGFDFGLVFPRCGVKQRWGLTCPTCGMTTSVLAFARGELLTAFYVQPAAAFLCSLLVLAAFFAFLTAAFGIYFNVFDRLFAEIRIVHLVAGLLVIIAAGWAVTLARALVARI